MPAEGVCLHGVSVNKEVRTPQYIDDFSTLVLRMIPLIIIFFSLSSFSQLRVLRICWR